MRNDDILHTPVQLFFLKRFFSIYLIKLHLNGNKERWFSAFYMNHCREHVLLDLVAICRNRRKNVFLNDVKYWDRIFYIHRISGVKQFTKISEEF